MEPEVTTAADTSPTIEVLTGSRTNSKCYAIDGYTYVQTKIRYSKAYYVCNQRDCPARGVMSDGDFTVTQPHDHHRQDVKIALLKFREELRQAARRNPKSMKGTYDELSSRHPLAAKYLDFNTAKHTMYYSKWGVFPTENLKKKLENQNKEHPQRENTTNYNEQYLQEDTSCNNVSQLETSDEFEIINQTNQDFQGNVSKSNSSQDIEECEMAKQADNSIGSEDHTAHIKPVYMEPKVIVKEEPDDPMTSGVACPTFESVTVGPQVIKNETPNGQDYVSIKTEVISDLQMEDNMCKSETSDEIPHSAGYQNATPVVGLSSAVTCSSAPTVSVVTTFQSSMVTTAVSSGSSLISSVSQYPQFNVMEHRTADISTADVKEEMLSKKMKPSAPAEQGQATNNTQQLQFPPSLPFTTSITPDTKMISSLPIVTNLTSPDGTMQYVIINQQPPSNILMLPSQQFVSPPSPFLTPLSNEVSQDTIPALFNPLVQSSANTSSNMHPIVHPFNGQFPSMQPPNGQPYMMQCSNEQFSIMQLPNGQLPNGQFPIMQHPNGQPLVMQSTNGQSSIKQPPDEQPLTMQPPNGQPFVIQPTNGQPLVMQSPNGQFSIRQPPNWQPLMQPPNGQFSITQPLNGHSPIMQPCNGQPTNENPFKQPFIGQNPIMQSSSILRPLAPRPIIKASMIQPPIVQSPSEQPPIMKPPSVQPPIQHPVMKPPIMQPPIVKCPVDAPPNKPIPASIPSTQQSEDSSVHKKPGSSYLSSSKNHYYVETTTMIKIDLTTVPSSLKKAIKTKVRELCDAIFFKDVNPNDIIIVFPLN